MNAELARALLAQGKKDGTHEGTIPEDDGQAVKLAEELVDMAQTAWDQHVRGPEVEILLKMAAEGAEIQETPKEEPTKEEPKDTPPPVPEPESSDGDAPVEPWEGYDSEKVSDIIGGINAGAKEYGIDDFTSLMGDVWAYEFNNKKRKTILDHLEAIAERVQAGKQPVEGDDSEPAEGSAEDTGASGDVAEPSLAEEDRGPDGDAAEREDDQDGPEDRQEDSGAESAEDGGGEAGGDRQEDPGAGSEGSAASESEPGGEQVVPEHVADEPGQKPEETVEKKPRRQRRKKSEVPEEGTGDDAYDTLIREVEEGLERDRIHKPKKPDEDVPDLPWDWTKMSDGELQKFFGIYAAVAYYKNFQMSREERLALHCKAAADELHNALLISLDKYDENGKEKKVAVVEAEVESDENVKLWRRRQRKHETFSAAHRNELNSVNKLVEALSRVETFRHQEWERSGKLNRGK